MPLIAGKRAKKNKDLKKKIGERVQPEGLMLIREP